MSGANFYLVERSIEEEIYIEMKKAKPRDLTLCITLPYSTLEYYAKYTYSNLLYSTLHYTTRTSLVEEAVEVVEEPKNSTLLTAHISCQV